MSVKQIIFYNDTSFPFSVLAAAIRTGWLPADRFPQIRELNRILRSCGVDKGNARIYRFESRMNNETCLALWSKGHGDMVERAITSFLGLYGIREYHLVYLKYKKTPTITTGVWLTGLPPLRGTGLFLIHHGMVDIYDELVRIAHSQMVN